YPGSYPSSTPSYRPKLGNEYTKKKKRTKTGAHKRPTGKSRVRKTKKKCKKFRTRVKPRSAKQRR
ncbi:hypothetical protein IscW_ISCW001775, partial [Ixodes scapularis]